MRERSIHFSPTPFPTEPSSKASTAVDLVLRQARKLHRAAKTGTISAAMPAIRRAHAAGVFPELSISALYRERQLLQRKHFLRALAVEAGFPDWERFRPELQRMPPQAVEHFKVADEWFVFLNSWFSTEEQAIEFAREHGGRVLRMGTQAVVVSADSQIQPQAGTKHDA